MENTKKPRLFYLDFVRAIALFSILIIHFNASVTGYFIYPSKLFGSILPFGIYLGDFGSSLFFIVSGAALAYTTSEETTPFAFYKKRAGAVYPMFWLAWGGAFAVRFVTHPGSFSGAKTMTLGLTFLGLDNFAVAAGWVAQDFACVGEWFLGSILFLYLFFPLLSMCLKKQPIITAIVMCLLCIPVHIMGWDAHLVAIHALEFMFGMVAIRFAKRERLIALAAAVVLLICLQKADTKILCTLFSMAAFVLLVWLANVVDCVVMRSICSALSKYSYAVFLLHHIIILRMVENFDLANISRRDTVLLFVVYLLFTAVAALGLFNTDQWLRANLQSLIKAK